MKKALLALAAIIASTCALAGPARHQASQETQFVHARDVQTIRMERRRHKVWVPAHREHGRRVPGHYVWR